MIWKLAPDLQKKVSSLVTTLNLTYIDSKRIIVFRSFGSKARARARIWSLPRIWQQALKIEAHYCIEAISEKFDHLKESDQEKILIHELAHIPKNFSGSLLPHGRMRKISKRFFF